MDPRCFDRLARRFGQDGVSRRAAVRLLVSGFVAGTAAALGLPAAAAAGCTGRLCNTDDECCAGANCLNGGCNRCAARGEACSATRPCCHGTGTTCCNGACANTRSSAAHCGRCGNRCRRDSACSNGLCCRTGTVNRGGICCATNQQNCGGACVNLQTDPDHCGTCDRVCADNAICSRGLCCPPGSINCGGACANLRTNPDHCGRCGNRCPSRRCVDRACAPLKT